MNEKLQSEWQPLSLGDDRFYEIRERVAILIIHIFALHSGVCPKALIGGVGALPWLLGGVVSPRGLGRFNLLSGTPHVAFSVKSYRLRGADQK